MNKTPAQTLTKRTPTANKVLAAYPDSKDNYAYFIALCWQEDGFLNLTPLELETMRFAPSPESYSRLKRLKVAKGEVVLSPKTTKRNAALNNESVAHYGNNNASNQVLEPKKILIDTKTIEKDGYTFLEPIYQ